MWNKFFGLILIITIALAGCNSRASTPGPTLAPTFQASPTPTEVPEISNCGKLQNISQFDIEPADIIMLLDRSQSIFNNGETAFKKQVQIAAFSNSLVSKLNQFSSPVNSTTSGPIQMSFFEFGGERNIRPMNQENFSNKPKDLPKRGDYYYDSYVQAINKFENNEKRKILVILADGTFEKDDFDKLENALPPKAPANVNVVFVLLAPYQGYNRDPWENIDSKERVDVYNIAENLQDIQRVTKEIVGEKAFSHLHWLPGEGKLEEAWFGLGQNKIVSVLLDNNDSVMTTFSDGARVALNRDEASNIQSSIYVSDGFPTNIELQSNRNGQNNVAAYWVESYVPDILVCLESPEQSIGVSKNANSAQSLEFKTVVSIRSKEFPGSAIYDWGNRLVAKNGEFQREGAAWVPEGSGKFSTIWKWENDTPPSGVQFSLLNKHNVPFSLALAAPPYIYQAVLLVPADEKQSNDRKEEYARLDLTIWFKKFDSKDNIDIKLHMDTPAPGCLQADVTLAPKNEDDGMPYYELSSTAPTKIEIYLPKLQIWASKVENSTNCGGKNLTITLERTWKCELPEDFPVDSVSVKCSIERGEE